MGRQHYIDMVMEHTELVEKYVNGDIDDAAFSVAYDAMDEANKKLVTDGLKTAKPKILSEMSALRQERERIKAQQEAAGKGASEDFAKKFRMEQAEKAMKRFFSENELDDAEKATIRSNFEKLDDGAIDADLILENLKRVSAYSFPDKITAKQKAAGEEGAAAFNSRQSGSAGRTGSPAEIKEDDPAIKRIMDAAAREGISMTAEEAKRGLEAGIKSRGAWGGLKPLPKKA